MVEAAQELRQVRGRRGLHLPFVTVFTRPEHAAKIVRSLSEGGIPVKPVDDDGACALEHDARIIGLSALMTTTMVRMEDTINIVRERKLPIRVMVGGAAVTQAFADAIGADADCRDAVEAVRAAQEML